jgi:signal transduction histidine kinase
VGLLVFVAFFEYLRQSGLFVERVGLISLIAASCFIWRLLELRRLKEIESTQLRFLIYTTVIELFLTIARFTVLYIDDGRSTPNLYQEGVLSSSIRWAWLGISILSYVAVLGYWLEKISIEKAQALQDSSKVIALLREKENLIMGLMKANKTAVTGALSASIAHELNQPLGASNINIQFLKSKLDKGQLNPELGKEVLDDLERDNKRAATIVRSLRSIFIESVIKTEDVKVGQIIDSVLEIVNSDLLAKNIQVNLNVDQNLRVHIKDAEFQQVFLNLINNAVQSISGLEAVKGHIQIEATQNEDKAQISISDNGSGVPKERQLGLFELLNTTKETGMGLGLWLCKHIITRYEGSIYYKDAVGRGAKFVIELPLFNKNKMGLS